MERQHRVLRTADTHLTHLADGPMGFHLQDYKEIMPRPPTPQALAEHVDGYGEDGYEDRSAAEDIHDLLGSIGSHPVVCEIRETVEHEVLA